PPPPPPPPPPNTPPSIAWDGATNAGILGAWNGEVGCFPDLPISTRVPLIMSDDYTDPAQLNVVMEYQFGSATADDWYDKPYFEDMTNLGGGRYEYTFGPYLTEGDFRIRFTVRATDADGATAQLLERTILVRTCPPPPPPNQAPRIEWIDSGNGLTLNSTVDGFKCWPNLPDTVTVTANV